METSETFVKKGTPEYDALIEQLIIAAKKVVNSAAWDGQALTPVGCDELDDLDFVLNKLCVPQEVKC